MNLRIIAAAVLALTASAGAARAEIAPYFDDEGRCVLYGMTLAPASCEQANQAAAASGVDTIVTSGIGAGKTVEAPGAAGTTTDWTPGAAGLVIDLNT
jgi:hypothetical protein